METLNTSSEAPILIKIADKLKETQQEVDELVVQFALGKAEAKAKFEEIKKEFKQRVDEFKNTTLANQLAGVSTHLKDKFEDLELQLSLGRVEFREMFEEQKNKIEHALERLALESRKQLPLAAEREYFEHEMEKFKLKLEILRLIFALKKIEIKETFKKNMLNAQKKIKQVADKIKSKAQPEPTKYEYFKKEAALAYKHMKKAIDAL
ncbi:hypothetical protein C900_03833 [Fulvivirga imtechensis AK7]|uniref:Uncharacterized protein n=1 Tax=Fulvivirga imtechensis AK7 TaxID=1237149 RepID=L8JPL1_9BACT|nr:hypothetical protein [Fulvivirga imtechensis]ELR70148.1 hypothetical protein C900_03833 [Fulvivirga imtechensis AK7]